MIHYFLYWTAYNKTMIHYFLYWIAYNCIYLVVKCVERRNKVFTLVVIRQRVQIRGSGHLLIKYFIFVLQKISEYMNTLIMFRNVANFSSILMSRFSNGWYLIDSNN